MCAPRPPFKLLGTRVSPSRFTDGSTVYRMASSVTWASAWMAPKALTRFTGRLRRGPRLARVSLLRSKLCAVKTGCIAGRDRAILLK